MLSCDHCPLEALSWFHVYTFNLCIVGAERDVVTCELGSLVLWLTSPHGAQPPVKFQPIPGATACTVFAFKRLSRGLFLAVATTESVISYKYDSRLHSFAVQTVSAFLYFGLLLLITVSCSPMQAPGADPLPGQMS